MYDLYALKLKLRLRRIQFQSPFCCANTPYTWDLKLKLLRGRNEDLKKTWVPLWPP